MNIIALDYGSKNIGLAWCQTELGVVLPFGVVKDQKIKRSKDQRLVDIIKKEKIDKVVIGLPLGLDGKENDNTKKIRQFGKELKKIIALPVEFVDERFTSAEADRFESGGASRDEKSAMIILESYLSNLGHNF